TTAAEAGAFPQNLGFGFGLRAHLPCRRVGAIGGEGDRAPCRVGGRTRGRRGRGGGGWPRLAAVVPRLRRLLLHVRRIGGGRNGGRQLLETALGQNKA